MEIKIIDYKNMNEEEKKEMIQESINRIGELSNNIKSSFVEIGYHFKRIKESKGYIELGYNSIEEFSEDKFNLKGTSVKYMISVFDKFGKLENGKAIIDEEFKDYSYTQLSEFVPLINNAKSDDVKKVKANIKKEYTPDMSVGEIRKKRKGGDKTVSQLVDQNKNIKTKVDDKPKEVSKTNHDVSTYRASKSFEEVIKEYLDQRASVDSLFKEKYENKNKSIKQCCSFICSEVKKMNVNALTSSDEIFSLAVHYYDEDNIIIKDVNCKVVVSEVN